MPKVTEAHRQARRMQIMTAAFTCFGRKGFHQTTMQDICQEADLSLGAIYNYFDGKDDLIRAIAEQSRRSADALFDSVDTAQPAPQVLADLMQRLAYVVEHPGEESGHSENGHSENGHSENGHSVQVRLWGEALHVPEVYEALQENETDVIGRFAKIIRQGQESGEISRRREPEGLARALMAFYQGMVLQKALDPECNAKAAFDAISALLRGASARSVGT